MNSKKFIVIEGIHKNPNDLSTINKKSEKIYAPYSESRAHELAKSLLQKNVDNFYHRAWVLAENELSNNKCEECKKIDDSVIQNLIMHGFKICNGCNLSKTLFPI